MMKQTYLILLGIVLSLSASSQTFKKDSPVEVDELLSDSLEGKWQRAIVTGYDTVSRIYTVKLSAADKKITIPAGNPEKWIRPVVEGNGMNQYGQGVKFAYQASNKAINGFRCNAGENSIKKNIRARLAEEFKDYQYIAVEFNSFKGQNGYDDPSFKGQQVYPYKIEMLVHVKRTIYVRNRAFVEYQTWEYDRVYEYASRPGKKCVFRSTSSGDGKLLFSGWY